MLIRLTNEQQREGTMTIAPFMILSATFGLVGLVTSIGSGLE